MNYWRFVLSLKMDEKFNWRHSDRIWKNFISKMPTNTKLFLRIKEKKKKLEFSINKAKSTVITVILLMAAVTIMANFADVKVEAQLAVQPTADQYRRVATTRSPPGLPCLDPRRGA
jgi:hypothetical protein